MDPVTAQMVLMNQLGQFSNMFLDQIRALLLGLAILIAGLLAAALSEYLALFLFRLVRWEKLAQWAAVERVIRKARPDLTASVLSAQVVFWLVLGSFFMKALEKMNLGFFSELGTVYFDHVGQVLAALMILAVTLLVKRALSQLALLLTDHEGAPLAAGLTAAVTLSLGLYLALITMAFSRELSIALSVLVMIGQMGLTALHWNSSGRSYYTVVRVPDQEEG